MVAPFPDQVECVVQHRPAEALGESPVIREAAALGPPMTRRVPVSRNERFRAQLLGALAPIDRQTIELVAESVAPALKAAVAA